MTWRRKPSPFLDPDEVRTVTDYVIPPPATASHPVATDARRFPIRRVFCVGRNYAAHAREMGKDPDREPPFFFMKPADAISFTAELPPA
jgi:fumarylpyruvate hydrolase